MRQRTAVPAAPARFLASGTGPKGPVPEEIRPSAHFDAGGAYYT